MALEIGPARRGRERSAARILGSLSRDGERRGVADAAAGRILGWFSVGLGLMEALAPRATARLIGVPVRTGVLRLVGLREIVSGVGLLAQPDAAGWRWARVAGDLMDLALLGGSGARDSARKAGAAAAVLGVTALDVAAGRAAGHRAPERKGPPRAIATIGRSPEECSRAWSDPETLTRALGPGCSVSAAGPGRLRWTLSEPGRAPREARIEVRADEAGRRVEWHSPSGAAFEASGVASFEPASGGRGTVVRFEAEVPGAAGVPARVKAEKVLLRFKQLLETGMIPTTDGQPSGRRSAIGTMFQKAER